MVQNFILCNRLICNKKTPFSSGDTGFRNQSMVPSYMVINFYAEITGLHMPL